VRRRFAPWMHRAALRYTQNPPDAITKVWCNVSQCAFCGIHTGPTREKIVHQHFVPRTYRMLSMPVDPTVCKNTSSMYHVPSCFLLNMYHSYWSMKNSALMLHVPDEQNALRAPQISPDAKTQVRRNISRHAFCRIRTGPTRA
jgi:hypothetical protein